MPHYDLNTVKALAGSTPNIIMRGQSRHFRTSLGYEMRHVQECILTLKEEDFHKTYDYEKQPADSYKISFVQEGREHPDNLYIKFYIDSNQQLTLQMLSFHLDR